MENKGFVPYIVAVLISILLTGGFHQLKESQKAKLDPLRDKQVIAELASRTMVEYIWNFNNQGAKDLSDLLLQYPEVEWVVTRDAADKILMERYRMGVNKRELISVKASVLRNEKRIGEITLGINPLIKMEEPFDWMTLLFFETTVLVLFLLTAIISMVKSSNS